MNKNKMTMKFRAWNKSAKKMFTVNDIDGLLQNTIICCKHGDACQCMEGIDGYEDEVELLQFTGIKDKNGVETYVGDIIKLDKAHAENIGASRINCLIGFHDGAFMSGRASSDPTYMNTYLWLLRNHMTVIGNIHENPELLEVK